VKNAVIRAGFETLYFTGAHVLLRRHLSGVGAILTMHHVRPPRPGRFQPNRALEIAPDFLDRVITGLRRANVDLVSLDDMHRRLTERDFNRRFVVLTLDDGYRDNKDFAYPILKRHGAPFALYVPTSFPDRLGQIWWVALERIIAGNHSLAFIMDGEQRRCDCATPAEKHAVFTALYWWLRARPTETEIVDFVRDLAARYGVEIDDICDKLCMTWNELRDLAADPLVTIGAHTVNHVILAKATEEVARAEMKLGRSVLQAALGVEPAHFAYPFGAPDAAGPREFRIAAELGYKTAVTTRPGVLFDVHGERLMALPRLSLNGDFQSRRYVDVLLSGAATALWNGLRRDAAA
jgi:peptidoglycan/xylan/chitin deacetylase (PgdA/CDA1 family)